MGSDDVVVSGSHVTSATDVCQVGEDQERGMTSAVTSVMGRLPSVQLHVLTAAVQYLQKSVLEPRQLMTDLSFD